MFEYVSAPYVPYLTDEFTFTREFTGDVLGDVHRPQRAVRRASSAALNMPPSFVILDRVVWGVSALLGKLRGDGPWRAMLEEYRHGGPTLDAARRARSEVAGGGLSRRPRLSRLRRCFRR